MDHTNKDTAYLDSSHRKLSNSGLRTVVALPVCSGIIFCRLVLGVQSSCRFQIRKLNQKNPAPSRQGEGRDKLQLSTKHCRCHNGARGGRHVGSGVVLDFYGPPDGTMDLEKLDNMAQDKIMRE